MTRIINIMPMAGLGSRFYESEFNLINDDDVVCNKCNEEIKNGDKTI